MSELDKLKEKELFDIIKNKEFLNLECKNCNYSYDGTFSGRVIADDVFIHDNNLFLLIGCEGCKYTKVIVCDIVDNFDIARKGDCGIWDFVLKIYKRGK